MAGSFLCTASLSDETLNLGPNSNDCLMSAQHPNADTHFADDEIELSNSACHPFGNGDAEVFQPSPTYYTEKAMYEKNEPRHEKTCLCSMRTTKVQNSLHICAV